MNTKVITRDWLKIVAFVTMLLDHFAFTFLSPLSTEYVILRGIGRLSFPIFCVLFVSGFFYIKDYKRHFWQLLAFAVLSEIPFDMAFYGGLEFSHQNVMFSWFFGFVLLRCLCYLHDLEENFDGVLLLCILIFAGIAHVLHLDYGAYCQLCIGLLYFMHVSKIKIPYWIMTIVVCLILGFAYEKWAVFGSVFLFLFYDADRKPKYHMKYLYYIGYPLHLLFFGFIKMFVI